MTIFKMSIGKAIEAVASLLRLSQRKMGRKRVLALLYL